MMTVRRSSLRRSVAVFAVAAFLPMLAACGEDEKPEIKRAPASETPSASESPTASETPEPESPKAFIRRWQKLSDEMQVSGDTSEYRKLVAKSCESCSSLADGVDGIYKSGGHIEFDGSKVVSLKQLGKTKKTWEFDSTITLGKTIVVDRKGAAPRTIPGGKATYLVTLERRQDQWKIVGSLLRSS